MPLPLTALTPLRDRSRVGYSVGLELLAIPQDVLERVDRGRFRSFVIDVANEWVLDNIELTENEEDYGYNGPLCFAAAQSTGCISPLTLAQRLREDSQSNSEAQDTDRPSRDIGIANAVPGSLDVNDESESSDRPGHIGFSYTATLSRLGQIGRQPSDEPAVFLQVELHNLQERLPVVDADIVSVEGELRQARDNEVELRNSHAVGEITSSEASARLTAIRTLSTSLRSELDNLNRIRSEMAIRIDELNNCPPSW